MSRNHHDIAEAYLQPHRHAVATGLLLLLWLLLSGWRPAAAETRATAKTYSWSEAALGFGAGILSAYALHEGGHGAAASLTGTDLKWESGTYNQPLGFTESAENDTDGAILHGAGLATQAICSEVILGMDAIDKTSPYVRGIMFWNIANPIIYALDYWFLHRSNRIDDEGYQGDLAGVEHYAGKGAANTFAAASMSLALWQGYRFWKAQKRAPTPSRNGLEFGMTPTPQGGAMVTLQIPF
jgi:hypothetical protein